ncbi:MAG TPA: nitrogen regulation protein NR(I), partial [Gammaproteobacteria bacterium]|nr:nitrogen regulation protein NR(I) [Gammaproteobacteria bacterium]
ILETLNPEFERILLQAALAHTGGRKQEAAVRLGWGRNTLTRKLKELGLDE